MILVLNQEMIVLLHLLKQDQELIQVIVNVVVVLTSLNLAIMVKLVVL